MENKMDVNLSMEQYKRELIDKINSAPFPIGVTYYLLKDVYNNVESSYFNFINQQSQELFKTQQEALETNEIADEDNEA